VASIAPPPCGDISRETQAWLAAQPAGRFEFTFTPKHGSWLNLIEGFFSKFARSVPRHIRVASKQELKERIMAGIEDVNRYSVIHTWSYTPSTLSTAARAAANSIASCMPSRCRQIVAIDARSSAVGVKPALSAFVLATKSSTALYCMM
jgi:hypothetical protein